MKFEIAFEKTYPHSIEAVWHALTSREALGVWLMETDFVPEEGRLFEMRCENGEGGTDRYLCKVLELQAPRRMVWSWVLIGRQSKGETSVAFDVKEVSEGTQLTIRHTGEGDRAAIEKFKGGWPAKLEQLEEILRSA